MSLDMDTVRNLVKEGRTLEAIRVYREQTGADLNDALAAVDNIQHQITPDDVLPQADRGLGGDTLSLAGPDVTSLLQSGHKLDAIRIYREQTGASLKDATDAIKDLERRLDAADNSEVEHNQDVETLLRGGHKLDAIRVYRQQTGANLKDATTEINELTKNLGLGS